MRIGFAGLALAFALFVPAALAQPQLLTEKKFFTLPQYTTQGGKQIKNVRVGYETYGKLNASGDNAIFVAHFFSGTSHAAGRYKADEKAAGVGRIVARHVLSNSCATFAAHRVKCKGTHARPIRLRAACASRQLRRARRSPR